MTHICLSKLGRLETNKNCNGKKNTVLRRETLNTGDGCTCGYIFLSEVTKWQKARTVQREEKNNENPSFKFQEAT